jgi:haloalkane dehalogenase
MQRREFLEMAAGAVAAGAIAGPTQYLHREAPRRFAETPHGRIAYLERGSGDAALFLHGFPLSGYQWRGALERLAPIRRCLAPDFLGLGYTEVREGQSVAPDDQVAMLIAFLDRLSIPNVDLVASDSGGAVAQLVVARHPHRVRTLLLTNCDTEIDSPPPALQPILELSKAGTFVDAWIAPWLADKNLARSEKGIGGMCYTNPAHPTDDAIDDYFTPLVRSARHKALVHAYAISLERNPLTGVEQVLKRSTVPSRVVWGTGDTIFSAESPGYLDRTFGVSRGVRRLDGKKLFWPEELPDVMAEEARRLWSA